MTRTINKSEYNRFEKKTKEGIYSISNLRYKINPNGFVDVLTFNTSVNEQVLNRVEYDIRLGPTPFKSILSRHSSRNPKINMIFM
jgi:hypothetical protein